VSASRVRQAVVVLSLILSHAVDMDLINRNPIERTKGLLPRVTGGKPKRALEISDLNTLAFECGPYRVMVLLAGLTGVRWAELVALTPEDFDFRERVVHINKSLSEVNGRFHQVPPKSGKARTIPMPEQIIPDLREIVLGSSANSSVFKTSRGAVLRKSNFARNVFRPAVVRAGLTGVRFHDLRHTAISLQIEAGADILAVSRVAGHANPSITLNVYAHELDGSLQQIRNTLASISVEPDGDRFGTDLDSRTA